MLTRLILGATIAALLPTAALAETKPPETLTRTGKWVVNYDRDACHLAAQFGAGEDVMAMRFSRYELSDTFDFTLYGRRLATSDPRSEAKVDFGLGTSPSDAKTMNGMAGKLPTMLFGSTRLDGWQWKGPDDVAPTVSPQQEAAVSGVTIKVARKKPFRLEFGSLSKPMAQLRKCQTDLVKSWGYDPAVQTSLSSPVLAENPSAAWLKSSDYPAGAIAMGHNGMVQFRLDVDADGKVSGCHVLSRTSPDVFADTTCQVVTRRAKLKPALDAEGKPVRSYIVQKVRWVMGD